MAGPCFIETDVHRQLRYLHINKYVLRMDKYVTLQRMQSGNTVSASKICSQTGEAGGSTNDAEVRQRKRMAKRGLRSTGLVSRGPAAEDRVGEVEEARPEAGEWLLGTAVTCREQ